MKEIGLEKLPNSLRLELAEEGEEVLWRKIERQGIGEVAESTGFSPTQLYNWKNKDISVPALLVKEFLEDGDSVKGFKSGGRSELVGVELPLEIPGEFLTRISSSVTVNRDGVPVYYTSEPSLLIRFRDLLSDIFGIEPEVYRRSGLEVRFPRSIYLLVKELEFETDLAALIDEEGEIEDGRIEVGDRTIRVEEFDGELFSRSKRFEIALQKQDSEELESLISDEARRMENLLS